MRSAIEIYNEATLKELGNNPNRTRQEIILRAIKLGMEEAINECAERAKIKQTGISYVDKQSLLQLINSIK